MTELVVDAIIVLCCLGLAAVAAAALVSRLSDRAAERKAQSIAEAGAFGKFVDAAARAKLGAAREAEGLCVLCGLTAPSFGARICADCCLKVAWRNAERVGTTETPDAEGWLTDGKVARCPACGRVREGTAAWTIEHARACPWRPAVKPDEAPIQDRRS